MDSESDNYLKSVIINNKSAPVSIDDYRLSNIKNIVNSWAGNQLSEIIKSGSSAKGTAIKGVSDIDLFISLKSNTKGIKGSGLEIYLSRRQIKNFLRILYSLKVNRKIKTLIKSFLIFLLLD